VSFGAKYVAYALDDFQRGNVPFARVSFEQVLQARNFVRVCVIPYSWLEKKRKTVNYAQKNASTVSAKSIAPSHMFHNSLENEKRFDQKAFHLADRANIYRIHFADLKSKL